MRASSKFLSSLGMLLTVLLAVDGEAAAQGMLQTYYADNLAPRFTEKPQPGRNLFLILVLDTDTPGADDLGIPADGIAMIRLMESLFPKGSSGEHKLTVLTLLGKDVNKRDVLAVIRELKNMADPRDTLFFYYSGHGGWDEDVFKKVRTESSRDGKSFDFDGGHYLATKSGLIERSEIKRAMAEVPAQLRILMTDCCSNFPSRRAYEKGFPTRGESSAVSEESVRKKGREGADRFKFKYQLESSVDNLFFDSVGWVSVLAAPPGATTPGSRDGGIFTNAMLDQLRERILEEQLLKVGVDWKSVATVAVKKRTGKAPVFDIGKGVATDPNQEPEQVYSCVLDYRSEIKWIRELPEKPNGALHELTRGTSITIDKTFVVTSQKSAVFQDGQLITDTRDLKLDEPYVVVSLHRFRPEDVRNGNATLTRGDTFVLDPLSKPEDALGNEKFLETRLWATPTGDTPRRTLANGATVPTASIACYVPKKLKRDPTPDDLSAALKGHATLTIVVP